jgi:D-amino-acid oxidase
MWAQTTSFVAGGEWGPSVVNYTDEAEFARILAASYSTFKASIGESFGVSERPYYSPVPSEALEKVRYLVPDLLPPRQALERLPFENYAQGGYLYRTLLIEPPIFLSRLRRDLHASGVAFMTRIFTSGGEVLDGLDENIIVNCTGLGSRVLWQDKSLGPIKGQLALLPAQPGLEFLFSQSGYLFPRADAVIIGGTFEEGIEDPTPDPGGCQELVDHMANVLQGRPVVPVLPAHIHHPAIRPKLAPKLV